MDREKLIAKIMKEYKEMGEPVTREEAEEVAEMELKCKNEKDYTPSEKNRKPKKPRVIKISDEKQLLFDIILQNLLKNDNFSEENVEVLNKNKLIGVQIGTKHFKIDITEQRQPKKK